MLGGGPKLTGAAGSGLSERKVQSPNLLAPIQPDRISVVWGLVAGFRV